jgi:hypothetical protein
MRLTRKLYSDSEDEEDENSENTWKRRRNIGIVGAGTGATLWKIGKMHEGPKAGVNKLIEKANPRRLKLGGTIMAAASALAATGSEIKRRKLKKKNDENKA